MKIKLYSLALLAFLCGSVFADNNGPVNRLDSYYPLEVGNKWIYRCSVEGEFQFNKTVTVASSSDRPGQFRVETKIGKDPKPAVSYLGVDTNGVITTSVSPDGSSPETTISSTPKVGEKLGAFSVSRVSQVVDLSSASNPVSLGPGRKAG